MQTIKTEKYLGKRIKLSADIKTELTKGASQIWMRINGSNNKILVFENKQNYMITGSTDWEKYEIVIDVPCKEYFTSLWFYS